ncbi:MAG TPA: restriction endonuclease subunit S, partial [Anaerovoracaceae bacterium]|nr:restriction endonuclease subunit S [Anaerovoracaceae bacterium]
MKASELRQSILQAAVQGKLVPQDSYDEPASVLLERISAEKSKLVKEGKIKKEKPLPPIAENEVPYDLPEGWVWCRLGDLSSVQSSKRVFTSEFVNKGIPFFRGTEIGALATGQEKTPKYYITQKHYADLIQHTGKPIIGDLLMPSICPDGRIWLVDTNKPFYFKDGRVLWVRIIENCVNNRYIQQALKARLISDYVNIASGTTFAELKIFLLKEIVIPLPPLSEQHRIVSKVADLMSLCDKLE